jgi:hypothetical protein
MTWSPCERVPDDAGRPDRHVARPVTTPFTLEYQRDVDPSGKTHVGKLDHGKVRPATPNEVP